MPWSTGRVGGAGGFLVQIKYGGIGVVGGCEERAGLDGESVCQAGDGSHFKSTSQPPELEDAGVRCFWKGQTLHLNAVQRKKNPNNYKKPQAYKHSPACQAAFSPALPCASSPVILLCCA